MISLIIYLGDLAMAEQSSLEDALRGVPAWKLDQLYTDDHLLELSKSLTRWQVVSPFLGLTQAEEEVIISRHAQYLERQRIDVLRKWKEKQKERATYRYV